jgi:uncharacterized protein YbaR (Trm112 family)
MSNSTLLSTLVCPETHQPLTEAEPVLLEQLNALIGEGKLQNRAGDAVTEPLQRALVREDRQLLFPVLDDIPKMIADEAIPLPQVK